MTAILKDKLNTVDAGRLGYEIAEVDYLDTVDGKEVSSYEDVGEALLNLIKKNPDQFDIIDDTVCAITGYCIASLLNRLENHKDEYDAIAC